MPLRAVVVRLTIYKIENVVVLGSGFVGTVSISVNIFLSLEGRWPQANLYSQFCYDVLDNLLPNEEKDVFIDIKLSHHAENQAAGYCYGFTDEVYIEIARNSHGIPYTLEEIARNLAHELVHAKQFITNTPKSETEAYGKESELTEAFWAK